ncbi:hypothetical protein GCM10023189_41170 [Nibrella saemangeumensis]|uniref:OmpA-like domain-containing protein n=1 Tax=Nibrella saemangeumensis TaxID=1084526 RepID=A0ABP8NC05_9BACT
MFTSRTPWIILLLAWMAVSAWWHVCKVKQLCPGEITKVIPVVTDQDSIKAPPPLPAHIQPLVIQDPGHFMLKANDNISFAVSSPDINLNSLEFVIDSVADYLRVNPDRRLIIIGAYSPKEQNPTPYENLGVVRADHLKQYFLNMGLPDSQFETRGIEKGSLSFTPAGDSLYGVLSLAFMAADSTGRLGPNVMPDLSAIEALAAAEKYRSVFDPVSLYFREGSATYIHTNETNRFFKEVARYLRDDRNRFKKLLVTGHTSQPGKDNQYLARQGAERVRSQVKEFGIVYGQTTMRVVGGEQPRPSATMANSQSIRNWVTVVIPRDTLRINP